MPPPKTVLRVGAAQDADIVIAQPTVSKYHCELLWTGQGWRITDLNSTNGTFVNGLRLTSPADVDPSSIITLGRGVSLVLPTVPPKPLPLDAVVAVKSPAEEAVPKANVISSSVARSMPRKPMPLAMMVISMSMGIVALAVVLSATNLMRNNRDSSRSEDQGVALPHEGTNPNPPVTVPTQIATQAPPSQPSASEGSSSVLPVGPQWVGPQWAIVLESADGKSRRLLGTAVAIDSNHLLTLASIIDAARQVEKEYPHVSIEHADGSRQSIPSSSIRIHPGFEPAVAKFAQFEKELKAKIDSLDQSTDPPIEDRLDWSSRLDKIMDEMAKVDAAVLETATPITTFAKRASLEQAKPADAWTLTGFPVLTPSPEVAQNVAKFLFQGKAVAVLDRSLESPSWFAESQELAGLPVTSLACLNDRAELVGLCVREEGATDRTGKVRCLVHPMENFWK